tara:strand:+ start:1967 stop:2782 length:816 start_codon:yes stop_codon:yes gene_type:complete
MKILKGRNLVWMVGMPIFFSAIWLGSYFFYFLIQAIIIIALKEFNDLFKNSNTKLSFIFSIIGSFFITDYYFLGIFTKFIYFEFLLIIFLLILFIYELFYSDKNLVINISTILFGLIYIPFLLGTVVAIKQFDQIMYSQFTLLLFISIWACDTAAFIFGSYFGKNKIFPNISPKKTWEGSIAGVLASVLIFFIFFKANLLLDNNNFIKIIILAIFVSVSGQIGDLFESKIKRLAGVKDSGTLLLGHGGFLDRFDSLIFASPIIYLYINFFI